MIRQDNDVMIIIIYNNNDNDNNNNNSNKNNNNNNNNAVSAYQKFVFMFKAVLESIYVIEQRVIIERGRERSRVRALCEKVLRETMHLNQIPSLRSKCRIYMHALLYVIMYYFTSVQCKVGLCFSVCLSECVCVCMYICLCISVL
jgi:hypothetical protein